MVPLIDQEQYTSHKYNQTTTINNVRIDCDNNFKINKNLDGYSKDLYNDGIPPHPTIEYSRHISTISSNILNANQNSLSIVSIDYISYFYKYYSLIIKLFPNLFPQFYKTHIVNLKYYINCNLIKVKSNIPNLSCISLTLTSHSSKIQSLNSVLTQLPGLINNVFYKLKANITLNINLLSLQINKIESTITCCQSKVREAINIICCIIKLICKCKTVNLGSQNLEEIKSSFQNLQTLLRDLYDKYDSIKCLKNGTQKIIKCNKDITTLKPKICELIKKFKCSLTEFDKIESCINCIKSIIAVITQKKQELFKYIEPNGGIITFKIKCNNTLLAYIAKINGSNGKNRYLKCLIQKIKSLVEKIDNICSEFGKIEDNTTDLKHSLMFNVHCFEISSHILEHLGCIESQQKILCEKLSDLKQVESLISVISGNIKDVKSVIEKVYESRDDLGYVRDNLWSIMTKLCQTRDIAESIISLKCVVNVLYRIKSSIEKLKEIEYDQKCLEIFDFSQFPTFTYSLRCIRDKLDINRITGRLSTVKNGISSLESVICNIKNLLACVEEILCHTNSIIRMIDEVEKCLDNVIKRFIRCSLKSVSDYLTNHYGISVGNDNNLLDNHIYGLYCVLNIIDYNVVNELLNSLEIYNKILLVIDEGDRCVCVRNVSNKDENYKFYITGFYSNIHGDKISFDGISKIIIVGNNYCLCMVIKYILYPMIYKIINCIINNHNYFIYTMDRNFNKSKYFNNHNISSSNILYLVLILIYKISVEMQNRYLSAFSNIQPITDLYCFCRAPNDKYYLYYINIILVLSSLIENIWSMDTESVRMSIECLSKLMSEFDIISVDNIKDKKVELSQSTNTPLSINLTHYINKLTITNNKENGGCKSNGNSQTGLHTEVTTSQALVNTGLKSFLKTIVPSLSILITSPLFSIFYSRISNVTFYIISNSSKIGLSTKHVRKITKLISVTYLDCTKKEKCTCPVKNECKICICGKIRYLSLTITMKMVRYVLRSVIKQILVDSLSLTTKVKIEFVRNACVNYNIQMLRMTKNNLTKGDPVLRSYGNTGVTNVETRNWGYDTKYEHDVTNDRGFRRGDGCANLSDPKYTLSHLSIFLPNIHITV